MYSLGVAATEPTPHLARGDDLVPETRSSRVIGHRVGDHWAQRREKRSELAVLRTDAPRDRVTKANRECRTCSAGRDGNGDVALSMDGGSDEVAVLRVVCRVEQDATLFRFAPDRRMKASLFGGFERGDREVCAVEVAVTVLASVQGDRAFRRELFESPSRGGRNDGHSRAGFAEPTGLRLGQRTTTDHHGDAAAEVEGNRVVLRAG